MSTSGPHESLDYSVPAIVGLEPFDDGVWSIYFYNQLLARMNERDGSIN